MINKKLIEKRKWIRLTKICNNKCLFCLDKDCQDGSIIPLSQIINELKKGHYNEKCNRVVLSGGEPTLHPDFIKIIKISKKIGYNHIQVITNGRIFYYNDFLKESVKSGLNEITFSIHGHTPNEHDLLTGIKGSFYQTLTGIINAKKINNLIISSDIVVNKINVDSLLKIIKLLYRVGVDEYDLLHIMPFGRAWENWKILNYKPEEKKDIFREVFKFVEEIKGHVWTNRFPLSFFDEENEKYMQHPIKLLDEIRGREEILNKFLFSSIQPPCKGERCNFCVLNQFCKDIEKIKKYGFLESVSNPECMKNNKNNNTKKIYIDKTNINELGNFFINSRLTIKTKKCDICKNRKNCNGVLVKDIIKNGFEIINPIK